MKKNKSGTALPGAFGSLPIKSTPSLLCNNLAALPSKKLLAYIHRDELFIVNAALPPTDAGFVVRVPKSDSSLIYRAKIVSAQGMTLVVFATKKGTEVWNYDKRVTMAFFENESADDEGIFVRAIAELKTASGDCILVGDSLGRVSCFLVTREGITLHKQVNSPTDDGIVDICGAPNNTFVSCDVRGRILVWDATDFSVSATIENARDCCLSLAASHKWNLLIAGFATGHIHVYSLATRKPVAVLAAHSRVINAIAYNETHHLLASAGEDGYVCLWSLPTPSNREIRLEGAEMTKDTVWTGVQFIADNELAAVAFEGHQICTWKFSA